MACSTGCMAFLIPALRQDLAKRLDRHAGINRGRGIRILGGPGDGGFARGELGHDEGAGEARGARVRRVDRGMGTRQHEATGLVQGLQAFEVRATGGEAPFERARSVLGNDGVEHYDSFASVLGCASSCRVSHSACTMTKAMVSPMPPKSLKLTQ